MAVELRMKINRFAILCFSFLFSQSVLHAEVVDTIHKVFDLSGRPTLRIRNVDGRTRILPKEGSTVEVTVTKEVPKAKSVADAKKAADRVEILLEQVGNTIEITAKYPKWDGGLISIGSGNSALANFEIYAPPECDIDASMVDGEMEAQGFSGKIDLSTVDGDMTVSNLSGNIEISAVDGDIHCANLSGTSAVSLIDGDISCEGSSGRLSMKAVDGEIRLKDFQGELETKSGDGDQFLDGVFESLSSKTTDGDVEIRARSGSVANTDWTIRSSDGDLSLYLPTPFPANVMLRTGDGKINTTLPIEISGRISERNLTGKMNGGGHLLSIETRDGEITISQSQ
jgi:DUF4097 and DUF4098 domain-containing protein YvlB